MYCFDQLFQRKGSRSPAARKRATRAFVGPFFSLMRHKMLCPSGDKIMPVEVLCQAFTLNFSTTLLDIKSNSYELFSSKCFKNKRKKMTLL